MIGNFEKFFKKISLLTQIQLEGVGLKLDRAEELDYFCFFIITTLSIDSYDNIEHYHLQFIEAMKKKYGQHDPQIFQLKKNIYQYYLLHALQKQRLPSGGDPLMSIAYLLSDQVIEPEYHINKNIILLSMTIKSILVQSEKIIKSSGYVAIVRHNP